MKTLLTTALFLAVCHAAIAQQAEVKDKGKELDYRKLVAGLVSPNKPIRIRNYPPTISIPPKFDWKAQERIEKNRAALYDHCEEALPFLIEGCTDTRFSLVSKWSEDEDYYTWSVGRVCSEIIQRHVEVFRDQMRFSLKRWHQYNFVPTPHALTEKENKEIEEWWRGRKSMSLVELQVAAFDWAIEKRKHEFKGGADDEEKGELKALVAARDKLRQSSKPLSDGVMWKSLVAPPKDYLGYKVVPWTEKGE
jgi:hypothetical protein